MLILSRCQFLISKWNVSKKSLFWEDEILFCGPGSSLSGWNHNRNKITIEFKRRACGSVVHSLSRFHGCMRWAELSLHTLLPTEAVSGPPTGEAQSSITVGDEGEPSTSHRPADTEPARVQLRIWLSEHWLFSSPRALHCSCQMALYFKSCCLPIKHSTRVLGEQGGLQLAKDAGQLWLGSSLPQGRWFFLALNVL